MMNKSKTKKAGLIKYSLILPAAVLLILASNAEMLLASAVAETRVNNPAAELVAAAMPQPQDDADVIFEIVEQNPQFPGGERALLEFLRNNIRYPVIAQENNIQGRVVVQFVIRATGEITDVVVVRGVDTLLDREAVRVVQAMPAWTPGQQRGRNVAVRWTLPVNFILNGAPQTQTAPADEIRVVGFASPPPAEDVIFDVVETQAQFPGGERALAEFIRNNLRYPVEAQENNIQGRVVVQFTINTDGSIQDIYVVRGVHPLLDREAVRVVQQMPNWIPAQQRGRNVRNRFTLPIVFRLDDDNASVQPQATQQNVLAGMITRIDGRLMATANHLIVVDGVAKGNDFELSSIDPNTVEHITILRNEAGVALFGERARDGVIMITMK